MQTLDISIVIPTWNREKLVESLLSSLDEARSAYQYGKTEVILVDSSEGTAKEQIQESCKRHDAAYLEGSNSVRKKRNKGIDAAQYEVICFIDSDVTVCKDLLNIHAQTFLEDDDDRLAGSFGLTEFVGKKSFWWKILEHTTYLDSFKFARMFPYQSWTIGNNVAFYKRVLLEIGKFREDLPFKLGGDDLEMTYRVTKQGYRIKSAPQAVAWHSRETWNHAEAIHNRTKRWGSMEYHIKTMHPELFVNCIPKTGVMFLPFLVFLCVLSGAQRSFLPLIFLGIWFLLNLICVYISDTREKPANPFFYLVGKLIKTNYRGYFMRESMKHGDFSCLYKEMSFSLGQTMYMHKEEARKLYLFIVSFWIALICSGILKYFVWGI